MLSLMSLCSGQSSSPLIAAGTWTKLLLSQADLSCWQFKALAEPLMLELPRELWLRFRERSPRWFVQLSFLFTTGKTHRCLRVNKSSCLPFACMKSELVFQCRFGPIPRTMKPTGLTVMSLDSLRRRATFSPLELSTQHQALASMLQNICPRHQSTLQG